ncbi:hypothetical protein F5880DRAFT_1187646 [Lentinula raphanica]|nr:hypothetical protein F5880DRAFT_1187646 [Lentinula raphanica]
MRASETPESISSWTAGIADWTRCFTDECNCRSLIGGPKITFWYHHTVWVDVHVSSTNEGYYDKFVNVRRTRREGNTNVAAVPELVMDLDRQAWEESIAQEFENQGLLLRQHHHHHHLRSQIPIPIPMPIKFSISEAAKSTCSLLRKVQDPLVHTLQEYTPKNRHSTKRISMTRSKAEKFKDASSGPVSISRKPGQASGWKKDAEQTLRKAVLLANANMIKMSRMGALQCGVQSREKSLLAKESRSTLSAVQA